MESTEGLRKRQQVASASASPYIPDDLVRRILLRLPSRSVLRIRAVCKAWLQLASDPAFALEHHSLQPALPLVSFLRGGARSSNPSADPDPDPVDCRVEAFDLRAGEFRPAAVRFPDDSGRQFRLHGSCDGLLLLSSDDRFFVCNPATHQWTRLLSPLRSSWLAGFYRHGPTGEYRALFFRGNWAGWPRTNYYILVPDSRKGGGIGLPAEKAAGYRFRGSPLGPPALAHGRLHWMPRRKKQGHKIMVFDTATEVVTVMAPPLIREHMWLHEVGGELAMSCCCGNRVVATVELWLLQDYANGIWVCKHRVRLPTVEVSSFPFDETWRVFFMSAEEGVVVVTPEQKLLQYDMSGTLLGSFPCNGGRNLKITPYTLKESLVRHGFFETHENAGDRDDEPLPPFFRGL
ncbi:unnamed protein product [Urochloa decumbens]|uniref:F-box domain-containing protein n=1 Tax=Urochloa decumbens TaxID=240449 RepID=A0ABC9DJL4_9POAL